MEDLYKDGPNSWMTCTRISKAGYEYHQQYPSQKPIIPLTNLKLTSTELNSNEVLSISKRVTCNRASKQKITNSQPTTASYLKSSSDSEMQSDSESESNETVVASNDRAVSPTAKMVVTDKFKKVKQTVRRRLVAPPHRGKTNTKTDSQSTTPSYLESNFDNEVQSDSEPESNETVKASKSRAISSTTKMVIFDKFRKVKQTVKRRLVVPQHREKIKTKTDSQSTTPSYLESNSDSEVQADSESDLNKTGTTSNRRVMLSTAKMVITDKFRMVKKTVRRQLVDPPHRENTKTKTDSQLTTRSYLESNSHSEVQEGLEFDLNENVTASNSRATSSTAKMVITDKFRKVKQTFRRPLVVPPHKEKTKTKKDSQSTTPSYLESNSDSEGQARMESDLNETFRTSNSRARSSTAKMAISGKFRKVKQAVGRRLVAPPSRKKTETKTDSQPTTISSPKSNMDSEVQADLESNLNKTVRQFNSRAISSTTKMVISSMYRKVKQTVTRRFVAPPSRERTVAETAKSTSSWLKKQKNSLLKKYFDRDVSQVGALDRPNGVEWRPDLSELIRWKMMASRVRSPLYKQSNEDGKMMVGLESDYEE